MAAQRTYLAIDLKSFYASVECVDRHLDPLTTNLVVADASRTEKTICLAVSPSLKAYKIPGRARLFEAVQRVKEVNAQRLQTAIRQKKAVRGEDGKYHFASTSFDANALNADPASGAAQQCNSSPVQGLRSGHWHQKRCWQSGTCRPLPGLPFSAGWQFAAAGR